MKYIAVIGMPRSGTTVVSAYLNSQPNAFILGEPHSIERRVRDKKTNMPYHISDTQYGEPITLYRGQTVMEQLEAFAEKHDVSLLGFKEAWLPYLDPIRTVNYYGDKIDHVIVTIREPRRNYQSILNYFTYEPMLRHVTFEQEWKALYRYAITTDKARIVVLDKFREDPAGCLRRATGLDIVEVDKMVFFPGNGDMVARAGGPVLAKDTTEKSDQMFPRIKRMYRLAIKVAENYGQ